MEESAPFDEEIATMLEGAFRQALVIGGDAYSDDHIRLLILTTHLKSVVKVFLEADTNPDLQLDLKKVALGMLGSIDWIEQGLKD